MFVRQCVLTGGRGANSYLCGANRCRHVVRYPLFGSANMILVLWLMFSVGGAADDSDWSDGEGCDCGSGSAVCRGRGAAARCAGWLAAA